MGGFFLTDDLSNVIEDKVIKSFGNIGLKDYHKFEVGNFRLLYFSKIFVKTEHYFSDDSNGNLIVGVGTFYYKKGWGKDALKLILNDLQNNVDYKSIFLKVIGHFNFILFINNEIQVITDKSGSYQSFYYKNNEHLYISNSLFSLIEITILNKSFQVNRQELFEYIMIPMFIGPRTAIKNIDLLNFGEIYSINTEKINSEQYISREIPEEFNFENYIALLKSYFECFKECPYKINSELTGGFDSRLILSILSNIGLKEKCVFVTYQKSHTKDDSMYAQSIAENENLKLLVLSGGYDLKFEQLVQDSLYKNEFLRDNFYMADWYKIVEEKSKYGTISIGGAGGESLRIVQDRDINNIKKNLEHFYIDGLKALLLISNDEKQQYFANIKAKFMDFINLYPNDSKSTDCIHALIYYLRMVYYGGTHINIHNYYTYTIHPFLDSILKDPLISLSFDERKDGKLQMKMIESFDKDIASYISNYGYNFIYDQNKQISMGNGNKISKISYYKGLLHKIFDTKYLMQDIGNSRFKKIKYYLSTIVFYSHLFLYIKIHKKIPFEDKQYIHKMYSKIHSSSVKYNVNLARFFSIIDILNYFYEKMD